MVYDFEFAIDRSAPKFDHVQEPVPAHDLEAILTVLEVAALCLTSEGNATFTLQQLIAEAQHIGGTDIILDEKDVILILCQLEYLQKTEEGLFRAI
jgi:hypothetical protein